MNSGDFMQSQKEQWKSVFIKQTIKRNGIKEKIYDKFY